MNTLARIDIEKFVDDYPNPNSIAEFTHAELEKYLSELLAVANEYGTVNKFPGGVNGFAIFLMLANTTRISAQESDFSDFTYEDLNIYKTSYQVLYRAIEERFENIFQKV